MRESRRNSLAGASPRRFSYTSTCVIFKIIARDRTIITRMYRIIIISKEQVSKDIPVENFSQPFLSQSRSLALRLREFEERINYPYCSRAFYNRIYNIFAFLTCEQSPVISVYLISALLFSSRARRAPPTSLSATMFARMARPRYRRLRRRRKIAFVRPLFRRASRER